MQEPFDQAKALADYKRLMDAGPVAENEQELKALIQRAYAEGLYFDYDKGKQAYVLVPGQEQDPFSSLDFEEQIKPIHWEQVHTKLVTPSFEATLTPDGRLALKFGSVEVVLERAEVIDLTRFLDQHAQVEPLAPPQEPDWFTNFQPTRVDPEEQ